MNDQHIKYDDDYVLKKYLCEMLVRINSERLPLQRLSNKIKIVAGSLDEPKSYQKNAEHYWKITGLVCRALEEPTFQAFLERVFEKEGIKEETIKDIQIKAVPLVKKMEIWLLVNAIRKRE